MAEINICNSAGRDAAVSTLAVKTTKKVRWLDNQDRQAANLRILKSSIDRDAAALAAQYGDMESVGEALLTGDPEVDLETTGQFLREVSRVYVDPDRKIVHKISRWEIIRNPDGSERDRRPRQLPAANVASEMPIRWSGRLVKKQDAYKRFVFVSKMQLVHVNGLTYDFLYGMAKELEESESLMLVGAGPKSNQPLILRRGASPYRGFLEGRTDGDRYCLILHLSNMELKAPKPIEQPQADPPKSASTEVKHDKAPKPASPESAEETPDQAALAEADTKTAAKKAADEGEPDSAEEEAAQKKAPKKKAAKKAAPKKKAAKKKAAKKKAAKKKAAKKKAAKKAAPKKKAAKKKAAKKKS